MSRPATLVVVPPEAPLCPATWCVDTACRLSHEHPIPTGPLPWEREQSPEVTR